jgi:hypothetical protein
MYDEPIEEVYFNWLYSKVASTNVPTPSLMFYTLLRDLHSIEFVFLISGDDNRAQDGLDIRKEFLREAFIADPAWNSIGCSVLEMFIALARKAEFETDLSLRDWFWIFLDNLGIAELSDARRNVSRKVAEVIDILIWRTYRDDGRGGMFPLRRPAQDQTKVELWYQLNEYLVENDIF